MLVRTAVGKPVGTDAGAAVSTAGGADVRSTVGAAVDSEPPSIRALVSAQLVGAGVGRDFAKSPTTTVGHDAQESSAGCRLPGPDIASVVAVTRQPLLVGTYVDGVSTRASARASGEASAPS